MIRRIRIILIAAAGLLPVCCGAPRGADRSAPAACYRILRTAEGTVESVPVRDYLIGAVGAEMPASFAPEALKAQTVAAHTYAEYFRRQQAAHPDPALRGAELSDDSSRCQAYLPAAALRERLGENGYAAVEAAVDAAGGLLLLYEGEPAAAVYHACSSGRTESAEAVWGTPVPYLVPAGSPADSDAPQYEAEFTFSPEEVREALRDAGVQAALPEDPAGWFSEAVRTESGTVRTIRCGDAVLTGSRIREIFRLPAACFSAAFADGLFIFRTRGAGHGVGMSQHGANAMAEQGCSFTEILLHYYPGTVCTPPERP